ncbi:MAG: hypothetical protein LQ342_007742 [Letrouitia transgressa]|nr:MAG: hypothetical protein LQ342_007742 [Letrouitia transgressa]
MSSIVAAGGVAHKLYGQRHGPDGDRWYICMPLYHGTGAISNLTALITGGMVAIGKGFSVRNFWNDIRDSKSTIFVYVGETIRYLLAAPPSPLDKEHKVRLAWGNGLRPDVWKNFQDRFGVPEIGEFFSSTEGMLTFRTWSRGDYLTNTVGHHGALLRFLTRNTQVPVANDHSTGEIQRDPRSGLAKRVPYEEGGEILVKVPDESSFSGYLDDHEASQKRFVRDILSKGDLYFRSGDALRRTKDGRWSFLDRLGDTYRWKGENVSTTEVAEVLGRYPGILEANVYGVLVPHTDGRAGCATVAIAPEQKDRFDWEGLASFAKARLPSYAVPVFIRIVGQVRGTHNNKQQKGPLRAEGANPNLRGTKVPDGKNDEMFWLPWKSSRYIPLTAKEWERLEKRSERL